MLTFSNRTPFKNIYRLFENECIEYDYLTNKAVIKEYVVQTTQYSFNSMEDALRVLREEIELQTRHFNKKVHKKFLFATGGLDSRVKLALDLFNNKEVMIGYWRGEDAITNGTIQDAKINKILATNFSLITKVFDVSQSFDDCLNTIDSDELDRYGEYLSIYAHNKKWLSLFDDLHKENVDEIEFGMDTDLLREIGSLDDSYDEPYNLYRFINEVCLRGGIFNVVFDCPEMCQLIKRDIQYVSDDLSNLSKLHLANVFNYFRHDMGCVFTNFLNEYYYSFPLLHGKRIWDIIYNIPYEYRDGSKLSLRLIDGWCPDMQDIPVFTHHHYAVYDKKKGVLKKNWKYSLILKIKPYILNSKLYDLFYVKWIEPIIRPQNQKNDTLFHICINTLTQSGSFSKTGIHFKDNLVSKGFDLAALCTITAKCKFIDLIIVNLQKSGYK